MNPITSLSMSLADFARQVCSSFKRQTRCRSDRRSYRPSSLEILEQREVMSAVTVGISMPSAGKYDRSEHNYLVDSKSAARELNLLQTATTAPNQNVAQTFFVSPSGTMDTQFNDVNSLTLRLYRDGSRVDLGLIEFYGNGRDIKQIRDPGVRWTSHSRSISPYSPGYDRVSVLTYTQGYTPIKHDVVHSFIFPDLTITNFEVPQQAIADGTISGSLTVTNVGNLTTSSAARGRVSLSYVDPVTGAIASQTDLGEVDFANMAAESGQKTVNFSNITVPAGLGGKAYSLRATITDPNKTMFERHEWVGSGNRVRYQTSDNNTTRADYLTTILPPAVVSISPVSGIEGNPLEFQVTANRDLIDGEEIKLIVNTFNGTAIAGLDYEAVVNLPITLNKLNPQARVPVSSINDRLVESPIETFRLEITSINGALKGAGGTGSIQDNDQAVIRIENSTVVEGRQGSQTHRVKVSTVDPQTGEAVAVDGVVSLRVSASDVTAKQGVDYAAAPQILRLGQVNGELVKSTDYTATIFGDAAFESDEFFQLVASDLSTDRAVFLPNQVTPASVTIINDDAPPCVSLTVPSSVTEGQWIQVLLNLSEASELPGEVTVIARNSAGGIAFQGTVQFVPGATSGSIEIPTIDDTLVNAPRTLILELQNPVNLQVLNSNPISVFIQDNDSATLSLIPNLSVVEGNSGSHPAAVTVTLSNSVEGDVKFNVNTIDITAKGGVDYGIINEVRTLPKVDGITLAGDYEIIVPIIGDTAVEPNEYFAVSIFLVNPAPHVVPGNSTSIVTIVNDDRQDCRCDCDDDHSEAGHKQPGRGDDDCDDVRIPDDDCCDDDEDDCDDEDDDDDHSDKDESDREDSDREESQFNNMLAFVPM